MHMADALLSPAVGIAGWAVALAAAGYSARQVRVEADPTKVPLMGVTAAFVFATQMVNFAIPGTGSRGHLGGGLLMDGPTPQIMGDPALLAQSNLEASLRMQTCPVCSDRRDLA